MNRSLTKASLDGNSTKVPIGAHVITNTVKKNSARIQELMKGAQVTTPILDRVEVVGEDGKQPVRDKQTNQLTFVTPETPQGGHSLQWSYDDKTGTLNIVRKNGDVLSISGFLRQEDFGVGPTGPRGDPGKDGKDADDGEDGKDGETGCEGPVGPDGRPGDPGEDGEDGPVGPTGLAGPIGPTGPQGPQGPEGMSGFEGKRGPQGFSCPATLRGPDGPEGRKMNEFVGMGPAPAATDLIWAAPSDCLCYFDAAKQEFIDIDDPEYLFEFRRTVVLECPVGQTVNGIANGPTSITGVVVERTYSDGSRTQSEPDFGGAFCAVPVQV